jgi:hypothetical protein
VCGRGSRAWGRDAGGRGRSGGCVAQGRETPGGQPTGVGLRAVWSFRTSGRQPTGVGLRAVWSFRTSGRQPTGVGLRAVWSFRTPGRQPSGVRLRAARGSRTPGERPARVSPRATSSTQAIGALRSHRENKYRSNRQASAPEIAFPFWGLHPGKGRLRLWEFHGAEA